MVPYLTLLRLALTFVDPFFSNFKPTTILLSVRRQQAWYMQRALVLLNTEIGRELDLVKELQKIKSATEVYPVYGVYDIMMEIQGETMDSIREVITSQIRKMPGIKSTLTMIIMK